MGFVVNSPDMRELLAEHVKTLVDMTLHNYDINVIVRPVYIGVDISIDIKKDLQTNQIEWMRFCDKLFGVLDDNCNNPVMRDNTDDSDYDFVFSFVLPCYWQIAFGKAE